MAAVPLPHPLVAGEGGRWGSPQVGGRQCGSLVMVRWPTCLPHTPPAGSPATPAPALWAAACRRARTCTACQGSMGTTPLVASCTCPRRRSLSTSPICPTMRQPHLFPSSLPCWGVGGWAWRGPRAKSVPRRQRPYGGQARVCGVCRGTGYKTL